MSTQYPSEREEVGWMLKDIKEQQSSEAPTGAPAPCVWREKESGYESRQFDTACGGEVWLRMYQQFNFCPFCGHPLTVER